MMKHTAQLPLYPLALALAAVLASPVAQAGCGCPSDRNGAPETTSIGLGESFPDSPDLANHPSWSVYKFMRDGVEYVQINDQYGNVRAAVGMIETTLWVLPVGSDADRVTTSPSVTPSGIPYTLYSADDVEVILYQDGTVARWKVQSLSY